MPFPTDLSKAGPSSTLHQQTQRLNRTEEAAAAGRERAPRASGERVSGDNSLSIRTTSSSQMAPQGQIEFNHFEQATRALSPVAVPVAAETPALTSDQATMNVAKRRMNMITGHFQRVHMNDADEQAQRLGAEIEQLKTLKKQNPQAVQPEFERLFGEIQALEKNQAQPVLLDKLIQKLDCFVDDEQRQQAFLRSFDRVRNMDKAHQPTLLATLAWQSFDSKWIAPIGYNVNSANNLHLIRKALTKLSINDAAEIMVNLAAGIALFPDDPPRPQGRFVVLDDLKPNAANYQRRLMEFNHVVELASHPELSDLLRSRLLKRLYTISSDVVDLAADQGKTEAQKIQHQLLALFSQLSNEQQAKVSIFQLSHIRSSFPAFDASTRALFFNAAAQSAHKTMSQGMPLLEEKEKSEVCSSFLGLIRGHGKELLTEDVTEFHVRQIMETAQIHLSEENRLNVFESVCGQLRETSALVAPLFLPLLEAILPQVPRQISSPAMEIAVIGLADLIDEFPEQIKPMLNAAQKTKLVEALRLVIEAENVPHAAEPEDSDDDFSIDGFSDDEDESRELCRVVVNFLTQPD